MRPDRFWKPVRSQVDDEKNGRENLDGRNIFLTFENLKFEIIGIVADSPSDELKKKIDEEKIGWPQSMS